MKTVSGLNDLTTCTLWLLLVLCGPGTLIVAAQTSQTQLTHHAARYRLQPGDVITVKYRLSPEFDATLTLQPDGFVTLPLLGEADLRDRTLTEAAEQIRAAAAKRLNEPEVTVELKEFEKPYLTVSGEVTNPGKVEIHGTMTAMRAVALAGGFRDSANRSQVLLIRPIDAQYGSTRVINLRNMLRPGTRNEDVELQPRDMLIVSSDKFTKMARIIKLANPGIYVPLN